MTNNGLEDRDLRQRALVPPERLASCHATVVGVGAIGRQVALQLAAVGVPRLRLVDPDTVEAVNLAPQGYLEEDLDQWKVRATGALCRRVHSRIEVEELAERFRRSDSATGVVFSCVDRIEIRRLIWEAVGDRVEFLGDGRMSAEVVRVVTASDANSRRHYPSTLFSADEAYRGSCTSRSTVFTASIAAGLLLEQWSRWLRGAAPDPDITLNLLASELTVAD